MAATPWNWISYLAGLLTALVSMAANVVVQAIVDEKKRQRDAARTAYKTASDLRDAIGELATYRVAEEQSGGVVNSDFRQRRAGVLRKVLDANRELRPGVDTSEALAELVKRSGTTINRHLMQLDAEREKAIVAECEAIQAAAAQHTRGIWYRVQALLKEVDAAGMPHDAIQASGPPAKEESC